MISPLWNVSNWCFRLTFQDLKIRTVSRKQTCLGIQYKKLTSLSDSKNLFTLKTLACSAALRLVNSFISNFKLSSKIEILRFSSLCRSISMLRLWIMSSRSSTDVCPAENSPLVGWREVLGSFEFFFANSWQKITRGTEIYICHLGSYCFRSFHVGFSFCGVSFLRRPPLYWGSSLPIQTELQQVLRSFSDS